MANFSIKLGQIFNVYGTYVPTKAAAYLKPVNCGLDNPYFTIDSATGIVVDSLNFLSINQGDRYLIGLDDTTEFEGEGFLTSVSPIPGPTYFPSSYYPIRIGSAFTGSYRLWLRARSTSGTVGFSIFSDDVEISTISSAVADSSWGWYSVDFNPDTYFNLGIRFNETGVSLDKLYLSPVATSTTPIGDSVGPDLSDSPYITVSANVYPVSESDALSAPLVIYDYNTTASGIVADDWYNFDLNFLDSRYAVDFDGRYALVLYTSGSSASKYILWELVENDEYICGASIFKYNI